MCILKKLVHKIRVLAITDTSEIFIKILPKVFLQQFIEVAM